ncbi:LEAF RUST 10 DISEASE-RESISTANCE LOCUS RECEPTOR-LIKE PROTEIN KINASE-like 2.1 [Gastrolobium bilobum]|uniref:LEAF RUST 10 DISEASE-RESISTANCE LOCUS RECEPTOR-LIKE PROTEIN KINASE-like 2.1 n=1 Tax=Gastrolobium bilobum TaxID=150636 RepID=UPI002AB0EBB2|nr:LEAF RUST 10 DISEASE-RESISTANCE LOCUS RECEPTOR-LIKE PROTEIN KINASE-like 2.1 [Gastrolobium bilobum]
MMFKLACACFVSSLFLFFTYSSGSHNTSSSTICPTYRCTNGPNISYPFWLAQGSPPDQYCGYQELGLICSDHGNPIFSPPPGLYYYVEDIDYEKHSLKLIDVDTVNQTCPRALHNVPLGNLPLSHSPLNLNLSFYYNCSHYPSYVPSIKCLSSGANESFVFGMRNETKGFDWSENCQENVVVTVMKDQITSDGLMNEFAGAMNEGFVLDWQTASNCAECEASDGLCGYSNTRKELLCFCKDGSTRSNKCEGGSSTRFSRLNIGLIAGGIGALMICIILCSFRRKLSPVVSKIWKTKKIDLDIEAFIRDNGPPAIKRYSYSEIKKMTNSFDSKLGQGGYGQVYKGNLNNNCPVAVKVLNASKGNGEEFINEVASISRTSHVNIVNLLGFCLEGQKKALIYEFMPNGSLEKFIHKDFETNPPLSWERLHQIAEGIAKGLEYLHRGCNTRILHFDIKPTNILLDENLCPKISDFGLAKLCSKTHSIISMLDARGTIGYIAPEIWNRNFGGVSHKSDVYSYGMMILEMVGGRQNISTEACNSSDTYFPHWIYKHVEVGSNLTWHGGMTIEENEICKKMILVGLWCIQTIPSDRPPMSRVIEMLEGSLEQLQIPPKPFMFSPTTTQVEPCTTSSCD